MLNSLLADSVEPEFYPNSSTFVNLLGITDSDLLRSREADFTGIRLIELFQQPTLIEQSFDFKHLKSIHHHLFQDLYIWAGKPRSYDVKKGADIFTPADQLGKYDNTVFERSISYANSSVKPTLEESAKKLASCLGIINIYHPFPEGNGRTQRLFLSSLAFVFHYNLDWKAVSAWENVETSKQAHNGNYEPLENLIFRIISEL